MDEHRQSFRMRRLKDGRVVFNERNSVMNCVFRNISETGAKILVEEPYLLPAEFVVNVSGGCARNARKVWFRNNEMGIEFN
jgi:hypothetical protein